MSGRTYILDLLTSVMSLEAAAAPSLRLIWGFLAPSNRARANVPMDLTSGVESSRDHHMQVVTDVQLR